MSIHTAPATHASHSSRRSRRAVRLETADVIIAGGRYHTVIKTNDTAINKHVATNTARHDQVAATRACVACPARCRRASRR
jgi:hypothetical protein